MPWAKLDDQFFNHPKVVDLSKDAKLLYLAALTYAAAQLTDGLLSAGALRVAAATVDVSRDCAQELIGAGLWTAVPGGYQIHDYLEYNPRADKVRAERDAAKVRMARARTGHIVAEVPVMSAQSSPEVPANIDRSSPNPVPVPVPHPSTDPVEKDLTNAARPTHLPARPEPPPARTTHATRGRSPQPPAIVGIPLTPAIAADLIAVHPAAVDEPPPTPPGYDYPGLWAACTAALNYAPTWNYAVETKAVKRLLAQQPRAAPADLAAFLAYKATCWPFVDSHEQPTFSRCATDYGAWVQAGQPTRYAQGDRHAPAQLTGYAAREAANLASSAAAIAELRALDGGPAGDDSELDYPYPPGSQPARPGWRVLEGQSRRLG